MRWTENHTGHAEKRGVVDTEMLLDMKGKKQ